MKYRGEALLDAPVHHARGVGWRSPMPVGTSVEILEYFHGSTGVFLAKYGSTIRIILTGSEEELATPQSVTMKEI